MWIRSQNKEVFADLTNFLMVYDNSTYIIKSFIKKYNYFNLAEYSSKEKALKVLDMIQEKICGMNKIFQSNELYDHTQRIDERIKEGIYLHNLHPDIYPESNITYIPTPLFFQMPNDDEV